MLHLFKGNDAVEGGSEPGEYWWGEGDEKFFVDGEKEPSWFGTGSEDYFGFAWATPDYFSRAYHHQLYNEGGIHMKGSRVLARFQVQDHVPFQTSFEAALEKYYKAEANVAYAVMPWWYQQAGTEDGYGPVPLAARTGWYPGPGARDPARLEGEDLDVRSATSGSLVVQDMGTFAGTWSAGKHLLWFKNNLGDVGPGAIATWTVEATSPGRYGVHAALTQAPDFGSFRFRIDGKACGGTVDLYGGSVAARAEQKLCDATLEAGSHALEAVVTGRNGASSGHYLGLDYLRLEGQPTALPARAKAKRALKPARKAYDMRGRALEAGTPTHGRLER
jgi:hypothetical protein